MFGDFPILPTVMGVVSKTGTLGNSSKVYPVLITDFFGHPIIRYCSLLKNYSQPFLKVNSKMLADWLLFPFLLQAMSVSVCHIFHTISAFSEEIL